MVFLTATALLAIPTIFFIIIALGASSPFFGIAYAIIANSKLLVIILAGLTFLYILKIMKK